MSDLMLLVLFMLSKSLLNNKLLNTYLRTENERNTYLLS